MGEIRKLEAVMPKQVSQRKEVTAFALEKFQAAIELQDGARRDGHFERAWESVARKCNDGPPCPICG